MKKIPFCVYIKNVDSQINTANPDHKSVYIMTIFKTKTKRLNRINDAWWLNDWSSKVITPNSIKTIILTKEHPSNILLKSYEDSIAMNKTKSFISDSLRSSAAIDGTIIIGSASNDDVPELHEILLNIQPLGWVYIPGGNKNENQ